MLKNRHEAGRLLANQLQKYKNTNSIVLAIPRGGIVVGYEVARALSLPLDSITTRKIGHPENPEYALGAVDENGTTVLNKAEINSIDEHWLKEEIRKQKEEARRRTNIYRQSKDRPTFGGKIAIIVDDGCATGFTMRLAVKIIKRESVEKIIAAAPVMSHAAIAEIEKEGADKICFLIPPKECMGAVGAHYEEFEQVSDREVIELLHDSYMSYIPQTYG